VNNVPLRSRGRPSHSSDLSLLQSIIDHRSQLSKLPPTSPPDETLLPLGLATNGCASLPGVTFDEVIDYSVNVNNASGINGDSGRTCGGVVETTSCGNEINALPWSLIGNSQAIFSLASGLGPIAIKMEASDSAVPMVTSFALDAESCGERGGSLNTPPLLTSDLT